MKRRVGWRVDWLILAPTLLIVALGLLVLYSSGIKAGEVTSQIDSTRQFVYAVVGGVVLLIMARLDYRLWKSYAPVFYIIMLGSLAAVEVVGATALGAQRWINIGFFQFQPSEFSKILLILVLAAYYARVYTDSHRFRYLLGSLGILLPPLFLVITQPDLGTGLVFLAIWLAMTLASRVKRRYLVGGIALAAISLPILYGLLAPYQRNRLQVLLNPQADKLGIGYNVTQSIIAVGSGGWFGRGLSAGSQSQLNFLPSQHTDFIFAVLAEKLGFVGGCLLIVLFAILIGRIFILSTQAVDRFGAFLCIGVGSMLLFHVLINVGMNMGIMPVTGIPLPFVSAGGTSMIVSMAAVGLILSVARQREGQQHVKHQSGSDG